MAGSSNGGSAPHLEGAGEPPRFRRRDFQRERERGSAERSEWPMRPGGTTNTQIQSPKNKAKIKSQIQQYELLNAKHSKNWRRAMHLSQIRRALEQIRNLSALSRLLVPEIGTEGALVVKTV